jgi:hypothetical protein
LYLLEQLRLYLVPGVKFWGCHIRCYMGCLDTNKKQIQNPSVNRETNLLSLINPSLAHVLLWHFIVKSYRLIRLKKFVLQNSRNLCN